MNPNSALPNEDQIVEAAKQRDRRAVSQLYEHYFDRVFAYVLARVASQHDAEDITAQVFLRMVEAIPAFQWQGVSFAAWLFRIAHNAVIDHWRKHSKVASVSIDDLALASHHDPAKDVEAIVQREYLMKAIRQLSDSQAQVILLRFFGGLSNADVAAITGRSEGAVKSLQHSALKNLERLLAVRVS